MTLREAQTGVGQPSSYAHQKMFGTVLLTHQLINKTMFILFIFSIKYNPQTYQKKVFQAFSKKNKIVYETASELGDLHKAHLELVISSRLH